MDHALKIRAMKSNYSTPEHFKRFPSALTEEPLKANIKSLSYEKN